MSTNNAQARGRVVEALRAYKERVAAYDAGLAAWAFDPSVELWIALANTRAEVDELKRDLDQKVDAFKRLLDAERGAG